MIVQLYTVCWDEADMLGFFFRHYDGWVDRYVVYDDGSTDGSLDILSAHPKVEVRGFERSVSDSFCLSHAAMQDHAWKESRGRADWIVVTAIDEHLHLRGPSMRDYLQREALVGTTIVPALGFDMNHPTMPDDHGLLVERVTRGRARSAFNKLSIFNPDAIRETGFAPGRHAAQPIGELRLPSRDEVVLWHYKHLGFERNAERERIQGEGLGKRDIADGMGQHYLWGRQRLRGFWDEMEAGSSDLARSVRRPDQICVRPLWWEDRPGISRVRTAGIKTAGAPTVSVLIKCFNHAAYLRQTLESVLAQSFSDFELLVLDDASSDESAAIAREYAEADDRVSVEVNAQNGGISAAMNKLIATARGRYVAILNSDDYALPFRLQRQVATLEGDDSIDAVFSVPQLVDERGSEIDIPNPFRAAFDLPDFSSASWLRHFFFNGNFLCAPSAMVRKSAYDRVGPYDLRLHNLQDLDLWVRMAMAGLGLHVVDDAATAFRVRDGNGNASAETPSSRMRSTFEILQILDHYRRLEEPDLARVFDLPVDGARAALGRLAIKSNGLGRGLFGLKLLYDAARTEDACRELIRLGGRTDIFQIERCDYLERRVNDLARVHSRRERGEASDDSTYRPRRSDPDLTGQRIVVSGTSDVWLVFLGCRHKIRTADAYRSLFASRQQRQMERVDDIPRGFDIEDGVCLAQADGGVETYLVCPTTNDVRKYLVTSSAWDAFGFDGRRIRTVPRPILDAIARGSDIVLRETDEDWTRAQAAMRTEANPVGRLKSIFRPLVGSRAGVD